MSFEALPRGATRYGIPLEDDIGLCRETTAESAYNYLNEFRKGDHISFSLKGGKRVSGIYIKHTRGHLKISCTFLRLKYHKIISLRHISGF